MWRGESRWVVRWTPLNLHRQKEMLQGQQRVMRLLVWAAEVPAGARRAGEVGRWWEWSNLTKSSLLRESNVVLVRMMQGGVGGLGAMQPW